MIYPGRCHVVSANAWVDQSLKVLKHVTGADLSINVDDQYDDICYVTPVNRVKDKKKVERERVEEESKQMNAAKRSAESAKRKQDQDEEWEVLRKKIRLERLKARNDLNSGVDRQEVTVKPTATPRSASQVKKASIRIKLSLKNIAPITVVTTTDESNSDNYDSNSDDDSSETDNYDSANDEESESHDQESDIEESESDADESESPTMSDKM